MAVERMRAKYRVGPIGVRTDTQMLRGATANIKTALEAVDFVGRIGTEIGYEEGKSTATKAAKEDAAKHLKVASYSLDAQGKAKPPSLNDVGSFRIYDQEYQTALMAGYALDVETSAAAYMAEEMNKNPLDGAAFANKVDSYLKKTYETVHPSVLTQVKKTLSTKRNSIYQSILGKQATLRIAQDRDRFEHNAVTGIRDISNIFLNTLDAEGELISETYIEAKDEFIRKNTMAANLMGPQWARKKLDDLHIQIGTNILKTKVFNLIYQNEDYTLEEKRRYMRWMIEDVMNGKKEVRIGDANAGTYVDTFAGTYFKGDKTEIKTALTEFANGLRELKSIKNEEDSLALTHELLTLKKHYRPEARGMINAMERAIGARNFSAHLQLSLHNKINAFISSKVNAERGDANFTRRERERYNKLASDEAKLEALLERLKAKTDTIKGIKGAHQLKTLTLYDSIVAMGNNNLRQETNNENAEIDTKTRLGLLETMMGIAADVHKTKTFEQAEKKAGVLITKILPLLTNAGRKTFKDTQKLVGTQLASDDLQMLGRISSVAIAHANREAKGIRETRARLQREGADSVRKEHIEDGLSLLRELNKRRDGVPNYNDIIKKYAAALKAGGGEYNTLKNLGASLAGELKNIELHDEMLLSAKTLASHLGTFQNLNDVLGVGEDETKAQQNEITSGFGNMSKSIPVLNKVISEKRAQVAQLKAYQKKMGPFNDNVRGVGRRVTGAGNADLADNWIRDRSRGESAEVIAQRLMDPSYWVSSGVLRGGIPTQGVRLLQGIASQDPNAQAKALKLYQYLTQNPAAAEMTVPHLKAQLTAKEIGVLDYAVKRLNLGASDEAVSIEASKAIFKFATEGINPNVANAELLPLTYEDRHGNDIQRTPHNAVQVMTAILHDEFEKESLSGTKGDSKQVPIVVGVGADPGGDEGESHITYNFDKNSGTWRFGRGVIATPMTASVVTEPPVETQRVRIAPWPAKLKTQIVNRAMLELHRFAAGDPEDNAIAAINWAVSQLTNNDSKGAWRPTSLMARLPGTKPGFTTQWSQSGLEQHYSVPYIHGEGDGAEWVLPKIQEIIENRADYKAHKEIRIDFMGHRGNLFVGSQSMFLYSVGNNESGKPIYKVGIIDAEGTMTNASLRDRTTNTDLIIDLTNFERKDLEGRVYATENPYEDALKNSEKAVSEELLRRRVELSVAKEIRNRRDYLRVHDMVAKRGTKVWGGIGMSDGYGNWPRKDATAIHKMILSLPDNTSKPSKE